MSNTSPQLTKESNNCHLYNIRTYKNGYCDGGYYFVYRYIAKSQTLLWSINFKLAGVNKKYMYLNHYCLSHDVNEIVLLNSAQF